MGSFGVEGLEATAEVSPPSFDSDVCSAALTDEEEEDDDEDEDVAEDLREVRRFLVLGAAVAVGALDDDDDDVDIVSKLGSSLVVSTKRVVRARTAFATSSLAYTTLNLDKGAHRHSSSCRAQSEST